MKKSDGSKVLQQRISRNYPIAWGIGATPTTTLGDTEWADYSVSADVKLEPNITGINYAGIGLRSVGTCGEIAQNNKSGYWIKITQDGTYVCMKANKEISSGEIRGFDIKKWYNLKVSAVGNEIVFYVNNTAIYGYTDTVNPYLSGRAGLQSSFYLSEFDNLKIEEASESLTGFDASTYVERIDPLDSSVKYSGNWALKVGDSYKLYNRTSASINVEKDTEDKESDSIDEEVAALEYTFNGTGINFVLGAKKSKSTIKAELDGDTLSDSIALTTGNLYRQSLYFINGLSSRQHTVKITVNSGLFMIDCIEVIGETHKTVKADIKDHVGEYSPVPSKPNAAKPSSQKTKVTAVTGKNSMNKKAAKRAMNRAKIKRLSVKIKSKKKITVSWKKVYQVQISGKSNFKKNIINKFTKKTKLTVSKKIKSKKKYFVRVRAYVTYKNSKGITKKAYSKWKKSKYKVK